MTVADDLPISKLRSRPRAKIDKSKLFMAEPVRLRDSPYLAWLRTRESSASGIKPRGGCEAHHIKALQPRARSLKVSDEYAVPLTKKEHDQIERCTSIEAELGLLTKWGITDPKRHCQQLRAAFRLW